MMVVLVSHTVNSKPSQILSEVNILWLIDKSQYKSWLGIK